MGGLLTLRGGAGSRLAMLNPGRKNRRFLFARLEALEARCLLSAALPDAAPSDVAQKIDARFYKSFVDVSRGAADDWVRSRKVRADSSKRIDAYMYTGGDPAKSVDGLKRLGAQIAGVSSFGHVIEAWIPAQQVAAAARLGDVTQVGTVDYAVPSVTSAGDSLLMADKVRSAFAAYGIDGTGIKVGVISDGVKDRLSVGSELPSITIQPSHTGSGNEGTAMLEIVHDLAPGAQLYFSAPSTSVDMVSSINYLVGQGCNVIVDDLGFFGEPYFADGQVANAAQNAVNQGVVYVSAAGNYSFHQHYQAEYVQSDTTQSRGHLHEFAPGVTEDDLDIPSGASFQAILQWSDPFGQSANNYDLYLINANTSQTIDSSTTVQNGNDNPIEQVTYTNFTGSTVHAAIRINKKDTAAVRELELFTFANTSLTYQTPDDAIFGQQAVSGVLSVAAANASNPNSVAYYSSHGGSTVYTDFANQVKTVRQTLDGTAIDGVQTAIGISGIWPHNPFFGTSAAAPHAAAIAALLKQMKPTLTPAQVASVMANTAVDLGDPGYDVVSGAGRYNALDAEYSIFTPSAPDLADASDTGVSSTDNLTRLNTPTFTGTAPAGAYVRLMVDGVEAGAVQLEADATTYSVESNAPLADGTHVITVRMASGPTVALANNSNPSAALEITIDSVVPAVSSVGFSYNAPGQSLSYSFSKDVLASLTPADLLLTNVTTNTTVAAADISMQVGANNSVVFTFPNYPGGVLPDGNYHATFVMGFPTDIVGNALSTGGFDFFVLGGDANLDRTVDFNDLVVLAQNYNTTGGALWSQGDFTGDGNVDFSDLVKLAQNYGATLAPPVPPPPPQPMVLQAPVVAAVTAAQTKAGLFNTLTPIARPGVRKSGARRIK